MKYAYALLIIFIFVSCEKPLDEPIINPSVTEITTNKSRLVFDTFFRNDTITVDTDSEWLAIVEPYSLWLSVRRIENEPNKLFVYASEDNTGGTDRQATITIRFANTTDTTSTYIPVIQSAVPKDTILHGGELDDVFNDLVRSYPDNVIAVGSTASTQGDGEDNHGGKDFWVMRLNDRGNRLWSRIYGGSGDDVANVVVRSVKQLDMSVLDDGYLVAGYTYSNNGDVTGSHGSKDAWLIKIDTTGNLVWQKTFGTTGNDEFVKILPTTDANLLVSGIKNGDQWIMKINYDAQIIWEKTFGSATTEDITGDLAETQDGYYFSGSGKSADGDVSGKPTDTYDAWLVKINSSGDIQWKSYIGGSGEDRAVCIMGGTNGVMLLGSTESSDIFPELNGTRNLFAATFDINTGNLLWKKIIPNTAWDDLSDVVYTKTQNILLTGKSRRPVSDGSIEEEYDGSFVVINSNGDVLLSRLVSGTGIDEIKAIIRGGYHQNVFVGSSSSPTANADGWFGWLEYR